MIGGKVGGNKVGREVDRKGRRESERDEGRKKGCVKLKERLYFCVCIIIVVYKVYRIFSIKVCVF